MAKTCNKCNTTKELIEFYKNSSKVCGYNSECKSCTKIAVKLNYDKTKNQKIAQKKVYYSKNKEIIAAKSSIYYHNNKEYKAEYNKQYRATHKEELAEYDKAHRLHNLDHHKNYEKEYRKTPKGKASRTASVAKYDACKIQATPCWLTKEQTKEINDIYLLAKELQWLSEERLEVDHIIPLRGKLVKGLHVPWNLQILPKSLNTKKSNKIYE